MVLTFLAGYVNVEGIFEYNVTVSHYSGNISNFSVSLIKGDKARALLLISCIILFFLGSFLIGLVNQRDIRTPRDRYKWILFFQGIGLMVVYHHFEFTLPYLLAFYMGIQNGAFALYRGIRVRFTHMTGYLTEAALETAAHFRGNKRGKYIIFYLISMFSFAFGGISAALIEIYNPDILVPLSAILYFVVAFGLHKTTKID